jgi:hypothetical protein
VNKQAANLCRRDFAYSDLDRATASAPVLTQDALRVLVAVLSGTQEVPHSQPIKTRGYNQLTVAGDGDVTCECAGFSYRGMCSQARELKQAWKSPSCAIHAGRTWLLT